MLVTGVKFDAEEAVRQIFQAQGIFLRSRIRPRIILNCTEDREHVKVVDNGIWVEEEVLEFDIVLYNSSWLELKHKIRKGSSVRVENGVRLLIVLSVCSGFVKLLAYLCQDGDAA